MKMSVEGSRSKGSTIRLSYIDQQSDVSSLNEYVQSDNVLILGVFCTNQNAET